MLLTDGGVDGVQTSAQSRILRVTVRVSAAVAVWAYFVAALVLDARRALPLTLCVLALLAYAGALRVRRRYGARLARLQPAWCARLAPPPPHRARAVGAGVAAVLVGAHLAVVAALGARSAESWTACAGLAVLVGGCWACSRARREVNWPLVGRAFALQFWLGVLLLRTDGGLGAVSWVACGVQGLVGHARVGALFCFGDLVVGSSMDFSALPVTIFFSAICQVLMYLGLLQVGFLHVGGALRRLLGCSRSEAVCATANVFLGMTEAPLLVRPLLASMTPSELHCVMAGGFASVAGSVLAAYIAMGVPGAPLIASSVMSAPAAIGVAKLLYPSPRDAAACRRAIRRATPPAVELSAAVAESINGAASAPAAAPAPASTPAAADGGAVATEKEAEAEAEAEAEEEDDGANMMPSMATNVFEAAADGAIGAVPLVACITATLIAFLALVSLLDAAVGWLASLIDIELTFTRLLGWLFFPFAVLIGVPLPDCELVGRLIGTKTASNEFVAYSLLAEAIAAGELSARAAQAAAVALCGFANLGSCGIMLGGLSALAPTRKPDLAQGVLSAMVSGTLATMSSAAVASALYHAEAHGDPPAAPEALECGGAT